MKYELYKPKTEIDITKENINENNYFLYFSDNIQKMPISDLLYEISFSQNLPSSGDVLVCYDNNNLPTSYIIDTNINAQYYGSFFEREEVSKYKSSLENINKLYENAVNDLKNTDVNKINVILNSFARLYKYSFKNAILIENQCPGATMLCSYSEWKDNYNGNVKRGSKAIKIFVSAESKVSISNPKIKNSEININDGNIINDSKETIRKKYTLANVFDVSQINFQTTFQEKLNAGLDTVLISMCNLIYDNGLSKEIKSQTDINAISEILLNRIVLDYSGNNTLQVNNAVKIVISNAFNLPCERNLPLDDINYLNADLERNLKEIKQISGKIITAINQELCPTIDVNLSELLENTDGKFSPEQIKILELAKASGLDSEKINIIAKPYITADIMHTAIYAFKSGLNKYQVNSLLKGFTPSQISEIIKAYQNPNITPYQLFMLKNRNLGDKEMQELNKAIALGINSKELSLLTNYDYLRMQELIEAIKNKIPYENVVIIANKDLNALQMQQLRIAFESGLTANKVKLYLRPELSAIDMARQLEVLKILKEKGIENPQVNSFKYLVEDAKLKLKNNNER